MKRVLKASSGDGTQARSGTGLPVLPPRSAVVELVVIVLAIVVLDWLLPSQGLAEIGPSPYWLPVLLMTLQYGTVSGLLAAGVGIAMTMLPGVPEQGVGENHFVYLLRIWAQPILWIAVAVLLGQFRIRQIAVKRELIRQVEELSSQRRALADYATNLRQRCETIERRIAGRDEVPGLAAVAAVDALADPGADLAAALDRAAALAFPGADVSVYVREDAGLRLVASAGLAPDGATSDLLSPVHPLFRAVVERGGGLSILSAADEPLLAGEGLAAVAVRAPAGGAVVGLVKLDRAPPSLVGADTTAALSTLAAAIGRRYADADARADGGARAGPEPATGATAGESSLRGHFRRTMTWLRGEGADDRAETAPTGPGTAR